MSTVPRSPHSNLRPARAAAYLRVSTGRQAEEGFSLAEQDRRTREHAERMGWTLVGSYRDGGVSGAKESRPELDRLLADLPGLDVVIVTGLDRLGRSAKHLLELCDRLDAAGVALVSLREQIDTTTAAGRLLRTTLAATAEFERDLGRERTRAGIGSRARVSGKPWGEPGYGYRRGDDGHWIPEPSEAATARLVFEEYVERRPSYSGVARWLNREGIKPRRSAQWTPGVVRRLLTSPHVLGQFHHGGDWRDGGHERIIDPVMWDAAQRIATTGQKYAPSKGGRLPKRHVFVRGMLRCGICGSAMLPRSAKDQSDTYVCRTRKQTGGKDACAMPVLRRAAVDAPALRLFETWALDVDATRRRIGEQLDSRARITREQAERAAREVAEKRAALAKFDRDYAAGVLPAESYSRLTAGFGEEMRAAEAEHQRLAARAEEIAGMAATLDAEQEALRRLAELRSSVAERVGTAAQTGDLDAIRAAVQAVFSAVYVMPEERLTEVGATPAGTHFPIHARLDPLDYPQLYVVPAVQPEIVHDEVRNQADPDQLLRRVAVAVDVDANNLIGSGVLE